MFFYPHIMQESYMPVGQPLWTTNPNLNELFGIAKAEVQTPALLTKPFLI